MILFKTNEDLLQFFPGRVTFKLADLTPTLEMVSEEYLGEHILGDTIYNELLTAYNGSDPLQPPYDALLPHCQRVAAHLAMLHYTGFANVIVDPGGLMVGGNENSDRKPAAEWRTRDFERTARRHGMRALDVLVKWLFANVADINEWTDSEPFKEMSKSLVRETRQFNTHVDIGNSGYLFLRLRPVIRGVERKVVKAVFCGASTYDDLIDALNAGDLDSDQERLLEICHAATAHLAMAEGIVKLSLQVDDKGVSTFGSLVGGQTSDGYTTASDSRIEQQVQYHRQKGNGYLQELRSELQAQAEADEDHPFRSTPCFVDPDAEEEPIVNVSSPVAGFM